MGVNQKPYPPIVDTYSPTVVMGENIKIYFTLSAYTNISSIRSDAVLVDIVNIYNNESVVNVNSNKGYQLVTNLHSVGNGSYYVEILDKNVNIQVNQTYKVQLRFCSSEITNSVRDIKERTNALSDYISDYSTITLVKVISKPTLNLLSFPVTNVKSEYIISSSSLSVVGNLIFSDKNEDEILTSYHLRIYENKDTIPTVESNLFLDTDILFVDTKELNTINYVVKKSLNNNYHYLLIVDYETSSGYKETVEYPFVVIYENNLDCPPPYVDVFFDKEDGSAKIHIYHPSLDSVDNNSIQFQGYLILRRTDNTSNFTIWDEIKYFKYEKPEPIDETVIDYLVQAGNIYRYQAIPMDLAGYRGVWGFFEQTSDIEPEPIEGPIYQ